MSKCIEQLTLRSSDIPIASNKLNSFLDAGIKLDVGNSRTFLSPLPDLS